MTVGAKGTRLVTHMTLTVLYKINVICVTSLAPLAPTVTFYMLM